MWSLRVRQARIPTGRFPPLRTEANGPAMLTSRLPGSPAEDLHEVTTARLDAYSDLLGRLRAAPGPALAHRLPVRAWCGGMDWPRLVAEELVPRLPARHRPGLDALRDHALANLSRRADAGTLHDPDGRRPARGRGGLLSHHDASHPPRPSG